MAYLYTLPNSTAGIDAIAIQTFSSFPWMTPLILMFVYFTVFLGGITRQKFRTGTADYPVWSIIASLSILVIALLFSVAAGFIRLDWLVIVVSLNILSAIWLFLDKRSSEI